MVPNLVQEVQQLDNVTAQRSAATLLTSAEKADLWKSHLESEITKYNNDVNKKSFILNVISIIESDMFEETTKHNFDGTLSLLNYKASKLFSQDESYFLFNSLGKAIVSLNSAVTPTGCTCNSSQINTCTAHWAGGYTYCQKGAKSCKTTESGCGWFWLNQCNGDCVTVLTI